MKNKSNRHSHVLLYGNGQTSNSALIEEKIKKNKSKVKREPADDLGFFRMTMTKLQTLRTLK